MTTILTEHIRNFDQGGVAMSTEALDILGAMLKKAMIRKNLFSASPKILGYNSHNWNQQEEFQSLLLDCYYYAVVRKSEALKRQVSIKDNLDGLIKLNIGYFLLDKQKKIDPEGFRVFERCEKALKNLVKKDTLFVRDLRRNRIRNSSVLFYNEENKRISPVEEYLLEEFLKQNIEIYNEMITILAIPYKTKSIKLLEVVVADMTEITAFLFKHIVDILKKNSRVIKSESAYGDEIFNTISNDSGEQWSPHCAFKDFPAYADVLHREVKLSKKYTNGVKIKLNLLIDEILYQSRTCLPDEAITQTSLRKNLSWPKQTMSDYFSRLKELMKSVKKKARTESAFDR